MLLLLVALACNGSNNTPPPAPVEAPAPPKPTPDVLFARGLYEKVLEEAQKAIIEKPEPAVAPTTLAVAGRYVLTHGIFKELEALPRGVGGEIQLTDGIAQLLRREKVFAFRYSGTRYDCGSKLGFLQATVDLGEQHDEVGVEFSQWLARRA